MTNHENLAKITGNNVPVHEEAVGMLLAKIEEDYQNDLIEDNFGTYPALYQAMYDWLNAEVDGAC